MVDDEGSEAPGTASDEVAPYPAAWEADVVLLDGTTTRIRPIRPADSDALQAFHTAQSERSTYFRFFHPLERLPARELERLVTVDHRDRVALVAVTGTDERIIGVARRRPSTPPPAVDAPARPAEPRLAPLDPEERPGTSKEDDLLDIPAFLRRLKN